MSDFSVWPARLLAVAWAGLGEHEKANAMDSSFNSMKDDPRLIALLSRLGERMAVERYRQSASASE